jgi:hypothetical protein
LKKRAGRSPRTGGNGSDERRESKKRRTWPTETGRRGKRRRPRIPPVLFLLTPKLRLRTEALEVLHAKNPLTLGTNAGAQTFTSYQMSLADKKAGNAL